MAFARDRVAIAYRIGGGGRPRCGETGEGGGQTDTRAGTDRGAATRFYPPFLLFFEGAGACAGGPRLGKAAFGWRFKCRDKKVALPHTMIIGPFPGSLGSRGEGHWNSFFNTDLYPCLPEAWDRVRDIAPQHRPWGSSVDSADPMVRWPRPCFASVTLTLECRGEGGGTESSPPSCVFGTPGGIPGKVGEGGIRPSPPPPFPSHLALRSAVCAQGTRGQAVCPGVRDGASARRDGWALGRGSVGT